MLILSRSSLQLLRDRAKFISGLSKLRLELISSLFRVTGLYSKRREFFAEHVNLLLLLSSDLFESAFGIIQLLNNNLVCGLYLIELDPIHPQLVLSLPQ